MSAPPRSRDVFMLFWSSTVTAAFTFWFSSLMLSP